MKGALTRKEVWTARGVALAADAVQAVFFPLFLGGATEGADAVLDTVTFLVLWRVCGFHPALLPAFVGEALPVVDLFPSWTLAVLFITRGVPRAPEIEVTGAAEPAARPDSIPGESGSSLPKR